MASSSKVKDCERVREEEENVLFRGKTCGSSRGSMGNSRAGKARKLGRDGVENDFEIGLGERERLAVVNEEVKERAKNGEKFDGVFDKRYTKKMFDDILSNAPESEERCLGDLRYESLIKQSMTEIFWGGFSYMIVMQKLKEVFKDWRRVKVENGVNSSKAEELHKMLDRIMDKHIDMVLENFDLGTKVNSLEQKNCELEEEIQGWKVNESKLIEAIEMISKKVETAVEDYKCIVDFCKAIDIEFTKGVEECCKEVVKRFPQLDLGWLQSEDEVVSEED